MIIKPIETSYRDFRFRSRLEARWAVFFDQLGIEWDYEPQGYKLSNGDCYLPDFWIPFTTEHTGFCENQNPGKWVEIKGLPPTQKEIENLTYLSKETKHHSLLFVGPPYNNGTIYVINDQGIFGGEYSIKQDPDILAVYLLSHIPSEQWGSHFMRKAIKKAKAARFEHGETG